jgi:hypothetical protein
MMMMVMMVVMMMMMVMPARLDHDDRAAEVMVMVMVAHHLDPGLGRGCPLLAVQHLQHRAGIRDRRQQVGIGVGAQRLGWDRQRRGLT